MPLAGRCAIIFSMAILRYARAEGGLGKLFYSGSARWAAALAVLFLFLPVLFTGWPFIIKVWIGLFLSVLLFSRLCLARIGGATGDTLGAACELTEMAVAIAVTWSM
jgi:adenosylcobinamide-GDP ribazoletransferase